MFRSGDDFQFSLSYYYYLMGEGEETRKVAENLFIEIDADKNGVLTGRL